MTGEGGRNLGGAAELSYEDVEAGDWFETSGCVVSVEMIDAFDEKGR